MKKKILIQGMHCSSCSSNIEKSLRKLPAVKNVSVSLMTNKAVVEFDTVISDEELKKAVSRAGYKAVSIELI